MSGRRKGVEVRSRVSASWQAITQRRVTRLDDPPKRLFDSDLLVSYDVDAWLEQGLRLCPCHALVE